jgi:hypothetical protein
MDSSKLVVKFHADDTSRIAPDEILPVFHSWIRSQALPDHLLIDVADYSHVRDGPGVVLVAREANIYFDRFDKRTGLSYWRKQPLEGSFTDRLRFAFGAALEAAALLESSLADRVRLRTDRATFQINDRLLAPNTPETFAPVAPQLESFLSELYQTEVQLQPGSDPTKLFAIRIDAPGAPDLKTLLERLGSAPDRSVRARVVRVEASLPLPAPAATSSPRFDAGL